MSAVSPIPDSNPQQKPQVSSNPSELELPERYRYEGTIVCMLYSEYSGEAKAALAAVKEKAKEWLGESSSHEDSGRVFEMSMTLFLSPAQHGELMELVKGTPLEAHTVQDFTDAIERGVTGASPRVETSGRRRDLSRLDYGINAGHALTELSADAGPPWEKQRALGFDIWNGMIQLQNFAASMLRNVQTEITGSLIARAEADKSLSSEANIFEVGGIGIYAEAARLTREYAKTSGHLKEVQDAMLPLARALLALPSPILKEIVYSQTESCFDLLGRGLGLYGADPQPMVQALDDWKAFWDIQIPLLSRYFDETAKENEEAKASGRKKDEVESKWQCMGHYQGDRHALAPCKWDETVFHELRHEHLWGMRFMGVPGPIGDRAFEVLTDVLSRANAEAEARRPAYGETLFERDKHRVPDPNSVPAEHRRAIEQYAESLKEEKLEESKNLVHGVTDLIITGLPWRLPGNDLPLAVDPVLHLERTLTLLESAMSDGTARGLSFAARMASQELAIQLNHWGHVAVLDANPALAERTKKLFCDAKVYLPDDWATGLRERGILPASGAAGA